MVQVNLSPRVPCLPLQRLILIPQYTCSTLGTKCWLRPCSDPTGRRDHPCCRVTKTMSLLGFKDSCKSIMWVEYFEIAYVYHFYNSKALRRSEPDDPAECAEELDTIASRY